MKKKTKTCMLCNKSMQEGMLPGWWNCRCGFFIDIQEWEGGTLVQYRYTASDVTHVLPDGCLLVECDVPL